MIKPKPFCIILDLNYTGEISLGQWDGEQFYRLTDGDCYTPEGLAEYTHKLCELSEFERMMNARVENYRVALASGRYMPIGEFICRKEDMSQNGRLRLIKQQDGDICVAAISEDGSMVGLEFCTPISGGGKSPKTLAALNALAIAILEDNKDDPSRAASR
jgi:hypothetical protein